MSLPLDFSYPPMEARSVDALPEGPEWRFEPKWDGFRCLAFRDGKTVELRSKSGQTLGRYFPDVVAGVAALPAQHFVLDGEIVIQIERRLSFEALQLRLHPAESRVRKLAAERPALFVAFDLLADAEGRSLVNLPLAKRRPALERFIAAQGPAPAIRLSPSVAEREAALGWLGENVLRRQFGKQFPYSGFLVDIGQDQDFFLRHQPRQTIDCLFQQRLVRDQF